VVQVFVDPVGHLPVFFGQDVWRVSSAQFMGGGPHQM
jgi:hypothetical protein